MTDYNLEDLTSVENIFDFFHVSGYDIDMDTTPFALSELLERSVEGDVWTIVDQPNLTVLIIKAKKYNRKSFRAKVNDYLRERVGMKIVFYTDDFTHYNLTLIYHGIYNVKFSPDDPEMSATRVFESLQNREDLFDYTKEDINFVLLQRELRAKELIKVIREGNNSAVKIAFQEGGLKLIGEGKDKIIISQDDAPIPNMAVDVDLSSKQKNIQEEKCNFIKSLYKSDTGRELKLISLITGERVIYKWCNYDISGYFNYVDSLNENVMEDVLESLISQLSYRTAFNSETFHQQFGSYSPFFILGITLFEKYMQKEHEKIDIMYEEWKSRFSKVYQSGDLDTELFLKHSYLSLLVKVVLISKFLPKTKELTVKDSLEKLFKIFEERGIPIFMNDFFQWSIEENNVQKEVFIALEDANFIVDDIFRTIYQEMVSPATRHALGEFFTPPPLARKMVEESYSLGQYVLDPACGSGTFLVEILNFIESENISAEKKIDAVSKIYGFDVNPIAVLVSRSNLLLLTDKLFKNPRNISINIYLTDSLNPIDEFQSIVKDKKANMEHKIYSIEKWSDFGEVERFNMPAINDSLLINKKFFKYPEKFGVLLKELDKNLSKTFEFEKLLEKIYNNVDNAWLNEVCEGKTSKKLGDNFKYIAKKFYNLVVDDKNHIWAYLLYNAIGVRKMRETIDGVDLIIGNPPWITINSILSYDYKNYIKQISRDLDLYMGGKHTPNTELCSIFFYKTSKLYLRKNGKIFFVTTASIETGDQHSKYRLFEGFNDIFLWKFENDVFRIHNICIGATYSDQTLLDRLKIKVKFFDVYQKNKNWIFEEKDKNIYVPYNYYTVQEENRAKRLIPINELDILLPYEESFYKDKFNRGADLFPRIFYFIKRNKEGKIIPDKSLQTHSPWDFYPLDVYNIEDKYIYSVCKSTELVPFYLLKQMKCFIPVEREDHKYHKDSISPGAKEVFEKFKKIYQNIQKDNDREITDLWERLNYHNCLSNSMQFSKLKVIYNSTGSIVKSAVINEDTIIDTSLYYFGLDNINEAYYLCAILNSKCITKQIERTASTGASGSIRTIHKRALDFPIPKFEENNNLHKEIVNIGKDCERIVGKIIKKLKKKKIKRLKKRIKCKNCGKTYSKSTFNRYRQDHEETCEAVSSDYTWFDDDWKDLKDITIDEIELSRMKTQNAIFEDEQIKEKLEELDELVIELLTSQGD